MPILNSLSSSERNHWLLHLGAVSKDTPSVKNEVDKILVGGELPNINHPSYISEWLEYPELREEIESWPM